MTGIVRVGDMSTGHDSYPARPSDSGSSNVLVDDKPVVSVGDHWVNHTRTIDPHDTHDGVTSTGSPSVMVNDKPVMRTGDSISDGDKAAEGSSTIIANEN